MNTKMKTKASIGIALVVLMVAALAAPVSADYDADDSKMNIYQQGNGSLSYTYGTPFYQCIWGTDSAGNSDTATYNIDLSSIPDLAKLIEDEDIEARLYVYWTWSAVDVCDHIKYGVSWGRDYAVYPALEVEFNNQQVPFDYAEGTNWIDHYTDSKVIAAVGELSYLPDGTQNPNYVSYNFPAGTNCAMIPIDELSQGDNTVNVTNVHPYTVVNTSYCIGDYSVISPDSGRGYVCIQGVGLLLKYPEVSECEHWVAEGNDMTYVYWYKNDWKYDRNPEMATTKVTFTGKVDEKMSKATLTSVIPAGNSPYNRLYFNSFYNYWDGLWTGLPNSEGNLAVSETDVFANLCVGDFDTNVNVAGFQNGLYPPYPPKAGEKQMNVAGAFLVTCKEV
ncbi:MAG: DUF3344 domain-containing protein [Methanophagales archaeon]|nr:DUF3344 domain-containing protein [Methanophagales archaeon]